MIEKLQEISEEIQRTEAETLENVKVLIRKISELWDANHLGDLEGPHLCGWHRAYLRDTAKEDGWISYFQTLNGRYERVFDSGECVEGIHADRVSYLRFAEDLPDILKALEAKLTEAKVRMDTRKSNVEAGLKALERLEKTP